MKRLVLAAVLTALAVPAAASAATVPVASLSGNFAATNPSVAETADGVQFGPYANGGTAGGSLFYSGANGLTLSQITSLGYTETHNSSDDSAIAAPYLRIFLNDDADDVIFDPTRCATVVPPENTPNTWDVAGGQVRYDDDACAGGTAGGQQAWADVVAAHGSDVISGIYVTTGFAGGLDLSTLQTDLTVNGTTFCFNCGTGGTGGAAGGPGAPANTTTVIQVPVPVPVGARPVGTPVARTCKGDDMRVIHAAQRRGEHLLSVRATLRGRRLKVRGRAITVDLREQSEGNYNVRITSRFRTRRGHVRTVRASRALSVACS